MKNKPLLRTTMDLVDTATDHDNIDYARELPGEEPTFCFATFTIFNVYPDAELMWCTYDREYAASEGVPYGTRYSSMVLLPDGTTRGIETLAMELLGLEREVAANLFDSQNDKAALREQVDALVAC